MVDSIIFLFIGIWLCAVIGFHKTYTIYFPGFKGFQWQQHFHGVLLMSWFFMLIAQPLLIKYHKNYIHRTLGKAGYILAPLVCYSIYLLTRMVYYRDIANTPEQNVLGQLCLTFPTILYFGFFFALAMINRKDSAVHMRYMAATSLLMIGPSLSRALVIFAGLPFQVSVDICFYCTDIILVLFLLHDFRKTNNIKPALTIATIFIIQHLCWIFKDTPWWQSIAKWYVTYLF